MFKEISPLEIERAREALSQIDPALAKANKIIPVFEWRTRKSGFSGLIRLILEQQISVASANAIWNRLELGLGNVNPEGVLKKTIEELRGFGLSAPKAHYVQGVAKACEKGEVDFEELKKLDDDAASLKLMTLKGIGRWTAEAYLMWCEARTDLFPAADIALQEAIRILDGVATRPSTEALYFRSKKWSPYRSFAAHLLWGYYGSIKKNIIAMPQGVPPLIKSK
jgi:DNA-3-methyladenine glycosylase II